MTQIVEGQRDPERERMEHLATRAAPDWDEAKATQIQNEIDLLQSALDNWAALTPAQKDGLLKRLTQENIRILKFLRAILTERNLL